MATLRTALCDRLGIAYPIVQSGMGSVAGADLVAGVSRAGGLGVLGGVNIHPDELRRRIREVRALTDRPFGLNLWLHADLRPPADMTRVPDAIVTAVQTTLNGFRPELGLSLTTTRPPSLPDIVDTAFETMLEERVPVWSIGLGNPTPEMVERCHERGIAVMAMVACVEDARAVVASGVDIVVAQGAEAGGHRSTWVKSRARDDASIGTMALVPQVVDAVSVPVVAAGGIADGRGLVAALALGAAGVLLGTRFVATRESTAPEFWKKGVLEADGAATGVTDAFTGLWARALRNRFSTEYEASGAPVLPALVQSRAAQDIYAAAVQRRDGDWFPMWSGQSAGLIHDLPGAAEVVESVVREARRALEALGDRVAT